jgi:hypothetical protein
MSCSFSQILSGNTPQLFCLTVIQKVSATGVYDMQGKLVKEEFNLSGKQFIIEKGKLSKGMYFLYIQADKAFIRLR